MPEESRATSQQRGATLAAIFLTVFGFFSTMGGFLKGNTGSWQDYILLFTPLFVFILGVVSLVLLRRGKSLQGSSLVFVATLLLPVVTILLQTGLGWAVFVFALSSSTILIWRAMPKITRNWTVTLTVLALVLIAAMEWFNPSIRLAAGTELSTFFYAASAVLAAIFLVQAARQAWSGNIRVKLVISFTMVALVSVGIVGYGSYTNYTRQIRADIRQRLLNIVSLVAVNQDGDLHATILGPENTEDDSYQTILSQHQKFLAIDPDLIYTYTMRKNEQGQIYFVIDARQGGEPGRDPPGTIYDEPSELLSTQFDTLDSPVVEEDIYTDKYGAVLPSYAPFYRSDGTREGIVGVDIRAGSVLAQEEAALIQILITTAIALALVTGIGLYLGTLFTRPITNLSSVAQKITEGDLSTRAKIESTDEVGALATTFNAMTSRLQEILGSLEQQVAARTEQLRASADVGRTAASVLDPDDLLRSVVNLITERFGFYYAAVFTSDSLGRYAILREATGEAGRALKAQGHQLEIGGQSMVGQAVTRRRLRIALDVGEEAVRFANPLLPHTRSEIALPLVVGDQVLGALDVQSTAEAAFDESNAAVLQSMADQIAIALSNALSYTEAQAVARRSHALFAASREVGRVQADVADTIRAMMQAAADSLDYDRWCVLTFNELRTALVTVAAHDWPDSPAALDIQVHANQPLVRSAVRNETVQINDRYDVRWQELASAHLTNLLSVPIMARGNLIGVVGVSRSSGAALADGDVEVGRSLATLAAIAIENYHLLQSSQRTLRELDEANRQLTGSGWEKYSRRRGQQGIIWVSRSDRLEPGGEVGPQSLPEVTEALTLGHVATRLLGDGEQLSVAVPIKLRDVPIGTLRMIVPLRSWTTELSTSLESIAVHVAQASENARLIAESEERLARERALTEATEKIRQHNEIDSILETAATELARYLNANRIAVRMAAPGEQAAVDDRAGGNGHAA